MHFNAFISKDWLSSLQGGLDVVIATCWELFVGTATLQLAEFKFTYANDRLSGTQAYSTRQTAGSALTPQQSQLLRYAKPKMGTLNRSNAARLEELRHFAKELSLRMMNLCIKEIFLGEKTLLSSHMKYIDDP